METKPGHGSLSPTQKAIIIKHGSAPKIQAVNISVKKRRSDTPSKQSDDILFGTEEGSLEQSFYRKRPLSKTMTTTKSTMTNDEDYQVEVTKSIDDAEHSTRASSPHEEGLEPVDMTADDIKIAVVKDAQEQHQQKSLAWKVTPQVHFPPRDDSPLDSMYLAESLPQFQGSLITSSRIMDWNYVSDPVIEPPYEHRPDKSYLIHQNQPIPMNPLKVWPGYGGNLYFQPVRVESKPLNTREGQQPGSRSRSRATSRFTFASQTATTPDALSDSKYMYLPPSSPVRSNGRKIGGPATLYKETLQDIKGSLQSDLLFQRKMAHLDKDYVLNMKGNPQLHEDWSWIAGLESVGTLCIGDTGGRAKKQSRKPYSRTLVVEKVPRKFVSHPGNNPYALSSAQTRPAPLVQVKLDATKRSRYHSHEFSQRKDGSSEKGFSHLGRSSTSKAYDIRNRDLKRRLRLPAIPVRIKSHKVNQTSNSTPWEQFAIGSSRRLVSNTCSPLKHPGSRALENLSLSRMHTSPEQMENIALSITKWLGPVSAEKNLSKMCSPPKENAYLPQSADHDTDDEDRLNYEAMRSVYYCSREHRSTGDGRLVPNSTPL